MPEGFFEQMHDFRTFHGPQKRILLVADDPDEAGLLEHVLKEASRAYYLDVVRSVSEASDVLARCGTADGPACPDLILLDLDLSGLDGPGLMRVAKSRLETRNIPVIIMSSSWSAEAVKAAYDSHASCFVAKPSSDDERERVVRAIHSFWFGSATLPRYPV
jgi:CheY-like chemotaxis protein